MTPSADRTSTVADNSATFLMTNMIPQAPDNNQGPWADLENYLRTLVSAGNELYIISGGTGTGGTGSNGGTTTTIAGGHVTVPSQTWKVIIVLPVGTNDVSRVTASTRTIAVIMPNAQGIRSTPWQNFRVSVDQVEALTGFDFFSNVPAGIQASIESTVDNQ
jgi:endonuclease G